jgi:hypothetical protein
MASSATPYGFRPIKLVGGQPYAGGLTSYKIASGYATSIFTGDIVKPVTGGTVEKDTGTDAATPLGVFIGCSYTDPGSGQVVHKPYWPASTVASDAEALIASDPDLVLQIQADDTLAQTALFANAAIVQGSGNTATGMSGVTLDASSIESTATLPVKIIGFVDGPQSEVGDAYTDVYVVLTTHALRTALGLA